MSGSEGSLPLVCTDPLMTSQALRRGLHLSVSARINAIKWERRQSMYKSLAQRPARGGAYQCLKSYIAPAPIWRLVRKGFFFFNYF